MPKSKLNMKGVGLPHLASITISKKKKWGYFVELIITDYRQKPIQIFVLGSFGSRIAAIQWARKYFYTLSYVSLDERIIKC